MCVHFLHALLRRSALALLLIQYHLLFSISPGPNCVDRKKNTLNEQTMLLHCTALHSLLAHAPNCTPPQNGKRIGIAFLCFVSLSLSVQFMVTLQMSIILWPNRCRCCCWWKWWDFSLFHSCIRIHSVHVRLFCAQRIVYVSIAAFNIKCCTVLWWTTICVLLMWKLHNCCCILFVKSVNICIGWSAESIKKHVQYRICTTLHKHIGRLVGVLKSENSAHFRISLRIGK